MTSMITYFDSINSSSSFSQQQQTIIEEIMDEEEQICGDGETYTLARFLFIFLSSWIAFLGIVGNLLLFYLFIKHKYPNTPPTLYPSALAILDSIICLMYILLFGCDAMVNFWQWHSLFLIYHIYIVPAFVISRITQLAIPYMLIFATLERLVWIVGDLRNKLLKKMYSHQGRKITMIVSLSFCIILRLPTYFAVEVYDFPKCDDFFRSKTASASPWVPESLIYHIYDFHLLSIAQTVFPFIVLITFNFIIVRRLYVIKYNDREITASEIPLKADSIDYGIQTTAATEHRPSIFPPDKDTECRDTNLLYSKTLMLSDVSMIFPKRGMNAAVKSAIYTMVAIVSSYLLSNSLHLILTGLERSNSVLLRHPTDPNLASTFHTVFSDIVSFVYMFTSAIRVIIYYICNSAIRADLKQSIKTFFAYKSKNINGVVAI